MKPRNRTVSPILFAGTVLCFLLPFMTISCGGQKAATFTGLQLALGTSLQQPQMFGPPQSKKVDAEPLASLALGCAVLGLGLSFLRIRRSAVAPAVAGAVGALLLFVLKSKLDSDVVKAGEGMLQANYESGFWLATLLFTAGACWNVYGFTQEGPAAESCSHCGAKKQASANFCIACGTPYKSGEAAPASIPIPQAAATTHASPPITAPPLRQATAAAAVVPMAAAASAVAQPLPEARCPNCGAARQAGRFCTACGRPYAPLEAVRAVVTGTSALQPLAAPVRTPREMQAPTAAIVNPPAAVPPQPTAFQFVESRAPQPLPPPTPLPQMVPEPEPRRTQEQPVIPVRRGGNTRSKVVLILGSALLVLGLGIAAGWYLWGVEAIIVTNPPDARVFVDGRQVSPESFGRFVVRHLARRQHSLTVQKDGYADQVRTLDVPVTEFTEWITVVLAPATRRSQAVMNWVQPCS